jgi:hypothetical protein
MHYKLLALDLDGTVMDTSLIISEPVLRAVAMARAHGVRVTLATGRMFGATLPFAQTLGVDEPLICYQGALIRHSRTGEIYEHITMPADLAAEGVALLLQAGLFVVAYIDERLCVAERRPELGLYLQWHPHGAEVVVEPELPALVATTPPTKLLFVADPPIVTEQLARLDAHFAGQLEVVRSHQLFGELTAPGISKGAALAKLAERLGIARQETIAIGDQENDLSMIRWAGLGLAMGNAILEVQAAATAIVPPITEDGVAWAIERYVLGNRM